MKILGIDSSAKSASVAVTEHGKIISSFYINTGLTHSQTLMPMVENTLKCANLNANDLDLIAVNKGPGSFTGVRIGVAAAKGLADTMGIKTIGISTLETMAYNLLAVDCIAACVMDARCSQVYCALFRISAGNIERLTNDDALTILDLEEKLKSFEEKIILVGDGAEICYSTMKNNLTNINLAPESLRYQNAASVCLCAGSKCDSEFIESDKLVPEYLRLPQAERELKNKLKKVSD